MLAEFENSWNRTKMKRTASFDGKPFKWLSNKEKLVYDEFLKGIKENNIPHVDTLSEGGSCLMVFPKESISLSCIFSHLVRATIEIQVSGDGSSSIIEDLDNKKYPDFYVYDEGCGLLRSDNIDRVLSWINKLRN